MENLDPPPLPPKSRMGKWRVFALRAPSSLIWGGWGFAVPFYFVQDCSSRVKRKTFYRKSDLQMFLLISGGHILVIGGQFLSTNIASPYKLLL